MEADTKAVQKAYRRKSLLIHPDKVKHRESSRGLAFEQA